MIYLNDFAPHDGVLRVHLIAHGPDYPKSDAFLLELDGEYLLIDGGMEHITASYTYLVRLRARLADPGARRGGTCAAAAVLVRLPLSYRPCQHHHRIHPARPAVRFRRRLSAPALSSRSQVQL